MPETPDKKPNSDNDNNKDIDVDLFSRLPAPSPFRRPFPPPAAEEEDPIEEFWVNFSMITHTGERFSLSACFRNRKHFNAEMHKFETAKNMHIVLRDINDEALVIKRDALLHALPADVDSPENRKPW
jgi:hypothetical protein